MTIGILSWRAHKTLVNTLESYRKFGLDQTDAERIIFFQEISDADRAIAEEYGYQAHGVPINIGIAAGYKSLIELSTSDLFLFLENDWELISNPEIPLYDVAEMLRQNIVDVVRLRSTKTPGDPLWSSQYKGRELDAPNFLLDSAYWTDPTQFYPVHKEDDLYVTTAPFANWTNNPTMFRTQWLKDNIVPRMGTMDVEIEIQRWWQEQTAFNVGQHVEGLFTHTRLDR